MKNLKDYLSCLKSLINHIIKTVVLLLLFQSIFFAQQSTNQLPPENDSVFVMQKSPWKAVLMSAVIPGLGQIYNESYIKAPIVWGIIGGIYLGYKYYNDRYKKNKDLYLQTRINVYKTNRDFYRDQRDLMAIYMGIAYVLNLVDAYVDAQLFDFNIEENYITHQPMFGLKINLK